MESCCHKVDHAIILEYLFIFKGQYCIAKGWFICQPFLYFHDWNSFSLLWWIKQQIKSADLKFILFFYILIDSNQCPLFSSQNLVFFNRLWVRLGYCSYNIFIALAIILYLFFFIIIIILGVPPIYTFVYHSQITTSKYEYLNSIV